MRALPIFAAAGAWGQIASPQTTPTHNTSSSISKVIKLLTKLREDVETDEARDNVIYDKFACYCNKEKTARAKAIEDNKSVIVQESTRMTVSKRKVNKAEAVIKQMIKEIAEAEEEMKQQKSMLDKERTSVENKSSEQTETMNVLKQAIAALTTNRSTSFLEIDSKSKETLALVETMTGKAVGVSENSMGAATGYLTELYKQTSVDLQQGSKQIMDAITNYNRATLLSMKKLAGAQKEKNIQEKVKAEQMQVNAEATEAYNNAVQELKVDSKFFDTLEADCQKRADFHRAQQTSRGEEKVAINKAVEILEARNTAAAAEGSAPTGSFFEGSSVFLQMSSKMNSRVDSVSHAIAQLTKTNKGKVLNLLQGEGSEAAACANKNGAVEKLVCNCEHMITDLKSEIDQTTADRDECQQTSHNLEVKRLQATSEKKTAADSLADAEAQLKLSQDNSMNAQKKVTDNNDMKMKLESDCSATENQLNDQIRVTAADVAALDDAINALVSVYGADAVAEQAAGSHYEDPKISRREDQPETDFADAKQTRNAGKAIVDMLKMIKNQTANNNNNTSKELDELLATCKTQREELNAIEESLNLAFIDANNMQAVKSTLKTVADQTLLDAEGVQQRREQDQERYGNCATKINEYNNAIEAKHVDIQGLESVINFLGSIDTDFRG